MKILSRYILILAGIGLPFPLAAQEYNWLHIDTYKGLPSNNVYTMAVDRHGYLWMATDRGVVIYNGYELRPVDLVNKAASRDVWMLHEDGRGRMWLFSIAGSLGYVRNGAYRKAFSLKEGVIYPGMPVNYQGGISFVASIIQNGLSDNTNSHFFCVERNDTIAAYNMEETGSLLFPVDSAHAEEVTAGYIKTHTLHRGKMVHTGSRPIWGGDVPPDTAVASIRDHLHILFGRKLLGMEPGMDKIAVLDMDSASFRWLSLAAVAMLLPGEKTIFMHEWKGALTLITSQRVLTFDKEFRLLREFYPRRNLSLFAPSWYIEDSLLGAVLATRRSGVYFPVRAGASWTHHAGLNMSARSFAGSGTRGESYWWDEPGRRLAVIDGTTQTGDRELPRLQNLHIIPWKQRQNLVLTERGIYSFERGKPALTQIVSEPAYRACVAGDSEIFFVQKFRTFKHVNLRTGVSKLIDGGRYKGIVFDPVNRRYVVYGDQKILTFVPGGQPELLDDKKLKTLGITAIEELAIDSAFGNLVVKEEDKVLLLPDLHTRGISLYPNYILGNSCFSVAGNSIVVAGRFGVLFSRITGPGKVEPPILAANLYQASYNQVSGMCMAGGSALLSTDSGMYSVRLPNDASQTGYTRQPAYHFLLKYRDSTVVLGRRDTVALLPDNTRIAFDVVRAAGAGKVHYRYRTRDDTAWQQLDNDELTLQGLQPDSYSGIVLQAYDELWRSEEEELVVYLQPLWYQERRWQVTFWIAGLSGILLAIYVIIVTTRRAAIRQAEKRNRQLELELKSVYSQLNPHFIFNSLNGALYLVKTKQLDEAYEHIRKFSQLMRSYIRSSRNRYIPLRDEIENLQAYVQLQASRFKRKFDYDIFVAPDVDLSLNIPSLLLQPLVENAIIHGLMHKSEKGHLRLSFETQQGALVCVIDDDGVGRDASKAEKGESSLKNESFGSDLVRDLSEVFSKYEGVKIDISYIDKKPPVTGTTVVVTIKTQRK